MLMRAAILSVFGLGLFGMGCVAEVQSDGGDGNPDESHDQAQSTVTPCATPQRACTPDSTSSAQSAGVQYCVENEKGEEEWTACCGFYVADCECTPPWAGDDWQCNTPLVLSFENQAVSYSTEVAGQFDLTGVGMSAAMDWPTATTPWLALDRDGSGSIDDGGELFGSATKVGLDQRAPNGFYALSALDANRDGVIDARDPAFSQLLIWRDADADRASRPSELSPASAELSAIELAYKVDPRCDDRGNCEVERAAVRFIDASGREKTGSVIDVHLRVH